MIRRNALRALVGATAVARHGTMAKGVDYKSAKLNDEKVREMRLRRANYKTPYSMLAADFGVGKTVAIRVCKRVDWGHVQ